jgi:predicted ATP-binding protein involved in virulence
MSYSEELASAIAGTLTKYAELSQSLDRTFPVRLVRQSASLGLTKLEIAERLSEFEAKRKRLIESGLLGQEIDPHFEVPQSIDETRASVLSVYVRDVQEKLAVFDALAAKIDLFKSIINRRFNHKNMAISKENGITFTTDSGQPLHATSLSSGEQHEVVMLYELLFKVRPDSLILIDEPEISLHVAWQEEFLRDLQEMTQLSSFDVLIATHSPQIISDRWDLTVELQDTGELQEAVR